MRGPAGAKFPQRGCVPCALHADRLVLDLVQRAINVADVEELLLELLKTIRPVVLTRDFGGDSLLASLRETRFPLATGLGQFIFGGFQGGWMALFALGLFRSLHLVEHVLGAAPIPFDFLSPLPALLVPLEDLARVQHLGDVRMTALISR